MKDEVELNCMVEQRPNDSDQQGNFDESGSIKKKKKQAVYHQVLDPLCIWDCCKCWIMFQKCVAFVVSDPFFELFITLCIIFNTICMAMDHYDMSVELNEFLRNSNYFFCMVFLIEALLKIIALNPKHYFQNSWHIFDFITSVLPLIDLALEGVEGLSVLRSFRLLRIFRLAEAWPTFNWVVSMAGRADGALFNLSTILSIVIFIFAAAGMLLYGNTYIDNIDRFPGGILPRWNFTDFMHSFMLIFRMLFGEWLETMQDCTLVEGVSCVPFFLSAVITCNFALLMFFLALLLNTFDSTSKTAPTAGKIAEALEQIWRSMNCLTCNLLKGTCFNGTMQESKGIAIQSTTYGRNGETKTRKDQLEVDIDNEVECACHCDEDSASIKSNNSLQHKPHEGNREEKRGSHKEEASMPIADITVKEDPSLGRHQANLRLTMLKLTESKCFNAAIIALNLLSAASLIFIMSPVISNMARIFMVIFLLEMLMRWLALGFHKYFTDAWSCLDFVILMASLINFASSLSGSGEIPVLTAMRALRASRPIRAMSGIQGQKVAIRVLLRAMSSIVDIFLVCLVLWLFFAIMGVQLFAGKFFKCVDSDNQVFSHKIVPDSIVCLNRSHFWVNSPMNFDNTVNAYISLYHIATFKGWIQIMNDAVDSREVGQQPIREVNIYMFLYFVFFIIYGLLFTLSLLIGVIINNINEQRKQMTGWTLETFMTEVQKKHYNAGKKISPEKSQSHSLVEEETR